MADKNTQYYKINKFFPGANISTTDEDRAQADRDIYARLADVEDTVDKMPAVPSIPTKNGQYLLTIASGSGSSKIVSWQPIELPPLPAEAGSYVLKVTVDGTTVTYAWDAVESGK